MIDRSSSDVTLSSRHYFGYNGYCEGEVMAMKTSRQTSPSNDLAIFTSANGSAPATCASSPVAHAQRDRRTMVTIRWSRLAAAKIPAGPQSGAGFTNRATRSSGLRRLRRRFRSSADRRVVFKSRPGSGLVMRECMQPFPSGADARERCLAVARACLRGHRLIPACRWERSRDAFRARVTLETSVIDGETLPWPTTSHEAMRRGRAYPAAASESFWAKLFSKARKCG